MLADIASPLGLPATRGLDLLALAFLVGVGPYAITTELERMRRDSLDARLPDFLTDLASLHKAGLTLRDSLVTAANGNYGRLTADVRMAADQARWNIPVLTALGNLRDRIGTPIAQRTLTVVLEAGRTGGNVPEVLEIAAGNARTFVALREQRKRTMGIYTIITYVASFVFIGVAIALQGIFVPRMIGAFSTTAGAGLQLAAKLPTAEAFRALFYTAALVQALGNGIVGGIMGEGRAGAGLKHAWAMVAMVFAGFLLSTP
jgi:flagellar protein FlaJ